MQLRPDGCRDIVPFMVLCRLRFFSDGSDQHAPSTAGAEYIRLFRLIATESTF